MSHIFTVQENDSKRARALKKAAEEREMRRAKDREIARQELIHDIYDKHKLHRQTAIPLNNM